ncbi:MAG: response regulator [Salinivirgaceae bacterium]|jgi:signal transduction histidine kinase/ActR/RegA family two-component response regulator
MNNKTNITEAQATILIAEDSATQSAQLKHLLESHKYNVIIAQDGLEALEWLSKNTPALVLSDIVMPKMNGFELCGKIKNDKKTKNIPVILLTSLSDPNEAIEGLSCGADSFIAKPYNSEYLLSNIEKMLNEKIDTDYKSSAIEIEIDYGYKKRAVKTDTKKMVRFLLNIYQGTIYQNHELIQTRDELRLLNERIEELVENRAAELAFTNTELAYQNEEKEKRAAELGIANEELTFQNKEKEKRAAELIIANKELSFQNKEKEKRAAELIIANKELSFQNIEKEKRAAELIIANKELTFQNREKEKRADELILANKELAFQNQEKENRANELIIANNELAYQNEEKGKRAAELIIANQKLAIQNKEKEKRANELLIANKELAFQNREKEKRADELIIANKELTYQNLEKGKRAAELVIADKELDFQNQEKGKRAAELVIADKELVFQNLEKDKRAAELIIADKELVFQNMEKGKRAAELVIANQELVVQVEEKEKQEAANKELEAFSYSVSHDLRAPLRHIGGFVDLLSKNYSSHFDETGMRYMNYIVDSTREMGELIDALLTFSRLSRTELRRTQIQSRQMVDHVMNSFSDEIAAREIEINILDLPMVKGDETLLNQVWVNLISNALKYTRNQQKPAIEIGGETVGNQIVFYVKDNGVGFDMKYYDKLFGVFQRLHKAKDFEGIGIGLANVNRIVSRHGGKCWAESDLGYGAQFYFSIPV